MDTDPVDTLLVDVRAGTQGFAQDVAAMRATFDGTLVDGFERAGGVLERGLLGAIRRGNLGFDDLRRVALKVIDDIAAQAVNGLFSGSTGGTAGWVSGTPIGGASKWTNASNVCAISMVPSMWMKTGTQDWRTPSAR